MSSHYFDPQPTSASARHHIALVLPDVTAELLTDRGVFSCERVDPGTKLLLQETTGGPPLDGAAVLDLGCGYGPIAVTLARRHRQATVWAVDVNARAVELCRENAAALECPNVRALQIDPAEPLAALPDDLRFDLIWSNPPIRIGKPELHAMLLLWLGRLTPTGHAVLVVQKHLGSDSLQTWLAANGFAVERLTSRAGYRLLAVRPIPSAPAAPATGAPSAPTPTDAP